MGVQQPDADDRAEHYGRLRDAVLRLLLAAEQSGNEQVRESDFAEPDALASARNFAAYLGIRRTDIRELQRELHRLGLSSLGRIETHALDSLASAAGILARLSGTAPPVLGIPRLTYDAGERILARRSELLLGRRPHHSSTRIMVTLPAEAAGHPDLVRDLVLSGMQIARVNCAHDSPDAWAAMIRQVRRAASELDRSVVVLFDLPGPKLRTGPVGTGPGVIRWHAFKDAYGRVLAPARIWVTSGPPPRGFAHAVLPANAEFVSQLRPGDEIHFRDHQGRVRWLVASAVDDGGAWAEGARGAFVVAGVRLVARRAGLALPVTGTVGALPPMPREIRLRVGDALRLTPDSIPGRPGRQGDLGEGEPTAQIGCSLPEVFRDLRPGQRVYFDDGRIAARIEEVAPQRIRLRVTWTRGYSARLAEDRGINLPDSTLNLPALTPADLAALDFAIAHRADVDIVGLSFVRDAGAVEALYRELDRRAPADFGVLLKVETATAFQNLPGILLHALRRNRVGVMIARGDLGVEVGFERMAELQEEIASLCAAAHLPVVWATQVLETMAKKGMPSRAEVSDVVLAARTQCVMLNKGPHLAAAIRFLANVLQRMEGHQDKHFRLMRALRVATAVTTTGAAANARSDHGAGR
ncbi:MAG TPA: pyruvate kinase [Phycisphaerae bacterium]|nr:pyruvate kinase [Phycisphaerae bacterium]